MLFKLTQTIKTVGITNKVRDKEKNEFQNNRKYNNHKYYGYT